MGFLDKTFQKLKIEAEKALEEHKKKNEDQQQSRKASSSTTSSSISMTMAEVMHYSSKATRWEKAVVATDSVVEQVTKFDPDGIVIVCVGGERPDGSLDASDEIEWHEGIVDTEGLESTITQKDPGGPCPLGKTMEKVLNKALERDLATTPCSILVLTAGKPDDADVLEESLRKASQTVADHGGIQKYPLSITFIQIGDDSEASEYLMYLDKRMVGITEDTRQTVDIVDTMGYVELKQTVETMRSHTKNAQRQKKSQEKQSAILGAVAGAAIGVGGILAAGKSKNKKRVVSWGGVWNCFFDDEKISTLTVKDDQKGNLTIDGLHEETIYGVYLHNVDIDSKDFFIVFTEPDGEVVEGKFQDGVLKWSDETLWEPKTKWAGVLGAATAGAALVGATGYAIHKKFFQKIKGMEPCDYVIVLDRSANMACTDTRFQRR